MDDTLRVQITDAPQVAQMTQSTEVEDMGDENVWGVVGDILEWTTETEVPLAVVIVLLLIGGVREGLAWWFQGGHKNG